ncbi:hypothetical protein HYU21_01625 [Candidatus Woesearchaeota archaeon]|nr:hypothetical protein [Candidatus Woesearchaeota archaeon]
MAEEEFSVETEKKHWKTIPGLEGKIVTLGELQDTFLSSSTCGLVNTLTRTEKFNVYGRKLRIEPFTVEHLAYLCKQCNQIVLGAPDIKQINSSAEEYSLSCRACNYLLYEYKKK